MRRKTRKNVGLIGLGIIGTRAAAGLRAAGYHVCVWNRSPKPVPNFLASPAEVAQCCETIQLFVADSRALFDVLEAMKDRLTAEHVIICNATVGPEATLEAAKIVEERGARFLDAPFTGSKVAAENRQLVYYIGGEDAVFLKVKPVLEATSKAIVRIGGIGDAALIKVVTNMIAAVSIQSLAESLAIVKKAGLNPEVLAAALEQNACRSGTMDLKLPKMLHGDYEPHFSLKHMFKDVQLGIQVANALDVNLPATAVTAGVMYGALKRGWGELDFASIYRIYDTGSDRIEALLSSESEPAEKDPSRVAIASALSAIDAGGAGPAAGAGYEEEEEGNAASAGPAGAPLGNSGSAPVGGGNPSAGPSPANSGDFAAGGVGEKESRSPDFREPTGQPFP